MNSRKENDVIMHEANGLTSQHDIEIFRAWKTAVPGYDWNRAEVDRNNGLTLFYDDFTHTSALHFTNSICGYGGEGPHATVAILVEAGFGTQEELSRRVFVDMKASFVKTQQ